MREPACDPARSAALEHNRRAWDRLAAAGVPLTRPAADRAFADPRLWLGSAGSDDRAWLPARLDGLDVLCLAAGGGKHGPLYAAAGARVTVVDLSPAMLALDRAVARERRIDLEIIEGSMDDLSMLAPSRFDLVVHPVSTCYLPVVAEVFREVARVTKPGGTYVSQHKSPTSLQATLFPGAAGRYELAQPQTIPGPLPPASPSRLREAGTREYVHSLAAILGGICRAGFVIEDVAEPDHARAGAEPGSVGHRSAFLPPYVRVLARRDSRAAIGSVWW